MDHLAHILTTTARLEPRAQIREVREFADKLKEELLNAEIHLTVQRTMLKQTIYDSIDLQQRFTETLAAINSLNRDTNMIFMKQACNTNMRSLLVTLEYIQRYKNFIVRLTNTIPKKSGSLKQDIYKEWTQILCECPPMCNKLSVVIHLHTAFKEISEKLLLNVI